MFARYAFALSAGAAVTFALLFLMQVLVATGRSAVVERPAYRLGDFVRVEREQVVETATERPPKPPRPEEQPEMPKPELASGIDHGLAVSVAEPAIDTRFDVRGNRFGISDGEYLPIVKVAPVYPARALARRMEGYVLVEFAVTETGAVKDVVVVESTAPLFEKPAIEAVLKFRYKPRIVDGVAVEVRGVRNKIMFDPARAAG